MKVGMLAFFFASLLAAQTGEFRIHMILHAIGYERYKLTRTADSVTLNTTIEFTDRANTRTTSATLRMKSDYTPVQFAIRGKPDSVTVENTWATVQENGVTRTFVPPGRYFTIFGSSPFAVQMVMLRYWSAHGKPADLPMLRGSATAEAIQIKRMGRDAVALNGKRTKLYRYTIANLAFGREIVWMDSKGELVAAMTFAGGLPMEAVRTEYEPAFPQLYRSGVAQEMADLKALARRVPPERSGAFAIVGATLIDSTGAPPIEDSIVLVRHGHIAVAGPSASVQVPRGTQIVEAKGQTLLPGLWEMHIHASGVEFGPALLAAGITTARDCGGEFDYLVAQRDAAEKGTVPSPRMLLAGLVDAGGLKAFGAVVAESPEEGRAVVDRYHAARFQQIKLYTYLTPDVIKAICAEAHRLGMTVTGHVPQALNTFEGIEAGMDQINHLNYISSMLRAPGNPSGPFDVKSAAARKAIAFLEAHHTVVDPTAGWGRNGGAFQRGKCRLVRARHPPRALRAGCEIPRHGRRHYSRADERAPHPKPGGHPRSANGGHTDRARQRHGWVCRGTAYCASSNSTSMPGLLRSKPFSQPPSFRREAWVSVAIPEPSKRASVPISSWSTATR